MNTEQEKIKSLSYVFLLRKEVNQLEQRKKRLINLKTQEVSEKVIEDLEKEIVDLSDRIDVATDLIKNLDND